MNPNRSLTGIYFLLMVISAPLMAMYSVMPVFLFTDVSKTPLGNIVPNNYWVGVAFVVVNVSLLWFMNIALWKSFRVGRWKNKPEGLRYVLAYLFAAIMVVIPPVVSYFSGYEIPANYSKLYPLIATTLNSSVILLIMNLVESQREKVLLQNQKGNLEVAHLEAIQDQWKQQIHPHFLYNSLANMKALMLEDSKRAVIYVDHLSAYLRTAIQLAENNLISIVEEHANVENYLELMRIKFGRSIEVFVSDGVRKSQAKLPVFSLQILIENALKHNAFSERTPLQIAVSISDEGFLMVNNSLRAKFDQETTTGTGLQNLMSRYASFTDKKVEVQKSEKNFIVKIPLLYD